MFSVFVRKKFAITENITFADSVSGIRPSNGSKLAKNPKNDHDLTFFRYGVNVRFFWRCFVSLVNFGYWTFQFSYWINIITGSRIMATFFYKGLTRNPEIGNTPVWVLPNVWRLGRVINTKFGTNVSNRILLNAAKSQDYTFTLLELLKENQLGGGKINPVLHPD